MIEQMVGNLSCADDERFRRFWEYEPIPTMLEWWSSLKHTKALVGANRSGKTTGSIVEDVMWYTGMIPPALQDLYPHKIPLDRPRHVRIIVKDYSKALPELIWPLLVGAHAGLLPKIWAADYDSDEHIFYGPDIVGGEPRTGSFLSIFAADPDQQVVPKGLRGARIDHTHIVERTTRDIYTECRSRLGKKDEGITTITLDYCPQDGKQVWDYREIYGEVYNLKTDEKKPEEEQHVDIYVQRVEIFDNPHLDPKEVNAFVSSLKPHEVAYRARGLYTDRADDPFFDLAQLFTWDKNGRFSDGKEYVINELEIDQEEGTFEGSLERVSVKTDPDLPRWNFWEEPQDGEYYACFLDGAEGKPKSDYSNGEVWRFSDGMGNFSPNKPVQVAQLHSKTIYPDMMAIQCLCACNIFGNCLFVYERNNTVGGVVLEKSRQYDNVYRRIGRRDMPNIDESELLGWHTERWNKPSALQEAYTMMAEWEARYGGYCGIRSRATFDDMVAFQDRIEKDKNGYVHRILAARERAYDDCVTTFYMMAYIARIQKELLTKAVLSARDPEKSYKSKLEAKAAKTKRDKRFGRMKKQPSLRELGRGRVSDGTSLRATRRA
jgi:hypothetical protein